MARSTIPVYREDAAMTFRDFARDCWKQLGAWGYSEETREGYDRTWMQFLAFLKSRGERDDLRSFNDRNVFDFGAWLRQDTPEHKAISPNSTIRMLSALRALARYGMMRRGDNDRRLLTEDPTASFKWPQGEQTETKWAQPAEIRALVDLEVATYKAITRDVLIEAGIRRGQARRLNVEDFKQQEGRYYLAVTLKGRGQQRRQQKKALPISKALGEAIRAWLTDRDLQKIQTEPESPLLLNSLNGRWSPTAITNMIHDLGREAGITRFRLSPHKLRHAKNVRDRLAQIDDVTRARLNTHSSLRSQERYDHLLPDELGDAADASFAELQRWLGKPDRQESIKPPESPSVQAEKPLSEWELW